MRLSGGVLRAVGWTATSACTRAAVHLFQLAILTRFLTAEDFGLMAMTGIVLGFGHLFSDFGLGSAYIQRQSVAEHERSSLFWLNLLVGVGLTLILGICSPLLALFFHEPRMIPLVCLCGFIFPIQAAGQQLRMHTEKSLAFGRISRLEMLAAMLGLSVGVASAWAGLGVYALVLSALTVALSETVLAWILLSDGWKPLRYCNLYDVKSYLKYGFGMVGSNLMNHLALNIDLLIGGRLFPAAQLGLYSVPRNLLLQAYFVTNPIVTRIGFPLMSKVQDKPDKIRAIYLASVSASLSMNAPIYIACAIFAEDIVAVLLGPEWGGSVRYMRILALWGLMRSIGNPVGSLLASLGMTGLAFRWNAVLLCLCIPLLVGGALYTLAGLAWAMLLIVCLMWFPAWYFLIRPASGIKLGVYARTCVSPILLAILAMSAGHFAGSAFESPYARLVLSLMVAVPIYGVLTFRQSRRWWTDLRSI